VRRRRRGAGLLGVRVAGGEAVGRELASAGIVVVSGLARGVDGEAHRGALDAAGRRWRPRAAGSTATTPRAHRELARRMAEAADRVRVPPGVEPAPWRFPARNRIVAGLSAATVVVEARERSGALITADFALEEGREVFAVPGEITSGLSRGTNALLRLGATPMTDPADVFEALGIEPEPAAPLELSEPAWLCWRRSKPRRRAPTSSCA
jgi:DNA processing protein